jgi:hypothetical protein
VNAPLIRLRPSSTRLTLEGGQLRLFALAERLLRAAGADVEQPAGPEGLRAIALSWLAEHDAFLRSAGPGGAGTWPGDGLGAAGQGVLLSDDAALVALHPPLDLPVPPTRVLWATPATTLLDPPDAPAAALTLTEAEAQALRGIGVDALSLLRWAPAEVPARPRAVVLAVGVDLMYLLDDVAAALRRVLPGTPRPELLPDVPIRTASLTHAPVHTGLRNRRLAAADLVVVIGEALSGDLDGFQAATHGAAVLRVLALAPDAPAAVGSELPVPGTDALPALAAALPAGYRLAAADTVAPAPGVVPAAELAAWVARVLATATPTAEALSRPSTEPSSHPVPTPS